MPGWHMVGEKARPRLVQPYSQAHVPEMTSCVSPRAFTDTTRGAARRAETEGRADTRPVRGRRVIDAIAILPWCKL